LKTSQSYEASPAIWDHSVTCHPIQVNAPCLKPSQRGQYLIYLPRKDGRLSWPRRLVTYWDRRQSPIAVLSRPGVHYRNFVDRMKRITATTLDW